MSIVKEFKEFISRGNVMDLAVGVIVGSAFTSIVDSLVKNIFMPIISLVTGGIDFQAWKFVLGKGEHAATIAYGTFLAAVLNFFIVAIVIFAVVKGMNSFHRKGKDVPSTPTEKTCPFCKEKINITATRCCHCTSELID